MALQFYTFKMFETLIFADVPAEEKGKLSLKPAMVSLAACLPVLIAYASDRAVVAWMARDGKRRHHVHPFLGHFVSGIAISVKKNAEALGAGKGLIVTIFSVIYLVGTFDSSLGSYHRASEDYPSGADGHSRYHRPFCLGTTYLL